VVPAPIKISIVTPCLNSREFIGRTVRSVIEQSYDSLEYIVADGGSTDGSLEVLARYTEEIAHLLSAPDRGHYDAINKGFGRSTGEIMGWLNSNDVHLPWTLSIVSDIFSAFPAIEWLTTTVPLAIDQRDRVVAAHRFPGFERKAFLAGENIPIGDWPHTDWIQQEATFWRRSLWERSGAKLEPLVACDFELWARFFNHARLYGINVPLAGFRIHDDQRSRALRARYHEEAYSAFRRHGGRVPGRAERICRRMLRKFTPMRWRAALGLIQRRPIVTFVEESRRWQILEQYHNA
jgi:glycosyltransferase involved in cell wall biosynthesis